MTIPKIPRMHRGEKISAKYLNTIADAINAIIDRYGNETSSDRQHDQIELVDIETDIEHYSTDNIGAELSYDNSAGATEDKFVDNKGEVYPIADALDSLYLDGERHAVVDLPGGQQVIMPGTQIHMAKLDADLDNQSTALASVYEWDGEDYVDSEKNVTVRYWPLSSGETVEANTQVIIAQHRQSRDWHVIQQVAAGTGTKIAKLDGDLEEGSTATATVWEWSSGAGDYQAKSPTEQVTVYDWPLGDRERACSGEQVLIQQSQDGNWYIAQRMAPRMWPAYTSASGITAASASVPGSGTVTLYQKSNSGDGMYEVTDDNGVVVTKTAYNLSEAAVGGDNWVMVQEDAFCTLWVILEVCENTGS